MRPLETILDQLIEPVTWLEGEGRWSSRWDAIDQSPLIRRKPLESRPKMPWDWGCPDAVVRGIRADHSGAVWIWGEPEGQEETAMQDILLMAGRGHTRLSRDSLDRLQSLAASVDIGILTTPG